MPIADAHLDHWREHGYVVVDGLLSPAQLAAATADLRGLFPTWAELASGERKYRGFRRDDPHERGGMFIESFPFRSEALGDISLHPDLIDFARRALGTDDIALAHSDVTAKYAGLGADYHQSLHLDVGNNSPVAPAAHDPAMEYVACIVFYSDVTAELGATRVVSRRDSPATPSWPNVRDAGDPLYAHERPVEARAGSALIYTLRTWHRGARMTAASGMRLAHHLSFYNGACRWLGATCFHRQAETPAMHALITRSTPQQRWALGFPPPGNPYWTEDTIGATALRYPGIDFTPYRERLRPARAARGG